MIEATEKEPAALLTALRQLTAAVRAHLRLALVIFAGVVGVGMSVTLLTPPMYEAEIKVLVTRERVDPRVSPGAANAEMPRPEISEEEFNSELEIIRSREVVEAVAKEITSKNQSQASPMGWPASLRARLSGLLRSPSRQPEAAALDRAAARIAANLNVVSIRKSRVVTVTYRDRDPQTAAQVLNVLYEKYAEHHLQLYENSQAGDVFRHETEGFGRKLAETTEQLKRFDAQSGVVAGTQQKDLLLKQLYDTQAQVNGARTEQHELEQRMETLKAQLAAQPERIETNAVIKYVNALDKMKEEVLTMELQHTQLLQKYLPSPALCASWRRDLSRPKRHWRAKRRTRRASVRLRSMTCTAGC